MQNKCKLSLHLSLGILLSTYLNLAWAEDNSTANVAASEPTQVTWYACPLANNHVSYTTKPLDVHCQIAKHPPTDGDNLKKYSLENQNAPGLEQLQRLWYSAEFGRDGDLMKTPPAPKIGILLRQQMPKSEPSPKIKNNQSTVPAKIIIVPKPTPKQLVQRDIVSEQRALAAAQQQLRQAQKQGIAVQIQRWQQNVNDRQANIRVLRQELNRY